MHILQRAAREGSAFFCVLARYFAHDYTITQREYLNATNAILQKNNIIAW